MNLFILPAISEVLTLTNAGQLGIGAPDPSKYSSPLYKLAVNGSAIFTQVVVKLYNNWPDYVFGDNYKLRSLNSLEQYINTNKHLPDMPSTEEMQKKDGEDLGEMNAKLLQKVEELTLYVIQLKKEIEKLEDRNKKKENIKKIAK